MDMKQKSDVLLLKHPCGEAACSKCCALGELIQVVFKRAKDKVFKGRSYHEIGKLILIL